MTASADDGRKRKVLNRLKRARGQLDAVIGAVENGSSCRDVVTQLAAVTHALNRAGFVVVSAALEDCIRHPERQQGTNPEELEKIFLALA